MNTKNIKETANLIIKVANAIEKTNSKADMNDLYISMDTLIDDLKKKELD